MSRFISCAVYYALTGFMGFLFGRFIPKKFFDPASFLYRPRRFEQDGAIYESLGIKHWQNKLPDMSRILPGTMPSKRFERYPDSETVEIMLKETCVSEFVHLILCVVGLGCFHFYDGKAGLFVYFICVFVNLLFIIIQRYNRPRLERLLDICRRRENSFSVTMDETSEALPQKQ